MATAETPAPHLGVAAYFGRVLWTDAARLERLATLALDARWPWLPWSASFPGVARGRGKGATRVGGKHGVPFLVEGMRHPDHRGLSMDRAAVDAKNWAHLEVATGQVGTDWGHEQPFDLCAFTRASDLPAGKRLDDWIELVHELLTVVGAVHGVLCAWPSYGMVMSDTGLIRIVLSRADRDTNLGVPRAMHNDRVAVARPRLGTTYARFPRWGTYLHAAHLAAIGGLARVREVVAPAVIRPLGDDLTYIQLTASIETAMTAETEARRLRFETLMQPIVPPPV